MKSTLDLDKKRSFVLNQACFSQLTPDEIDKLTTLFVEQTFSKDDTIVTEGDHVDSVYLIVTGECDVRHVTIQNGKPHIESLATLGPGDAIGLNDTGFYSLSGIRTATVVANNSMLTLRLNTAEFHGFALMYPHVNEVMHNNAKSMQSQLDFKIE